MHCPRCQIPLRAALEPTSRGRIELDYCPSCRGVWFDAEELAALLSVENLAAFSVNSALLSAASPTTLPCPRHAHSPMCERHLRTDRSAQPLRIDQCLGCEGIWLDGDELRSVAEQLRDPRVRPFLDEPMRSPSLGLWLFMFFTGLPIEAGNPRVRRPVVTSALIALCALVFAWQMTVGLDVSVLQLGLIPARLRGGGFSGLLSYMFLHGSAVHILGNLYFLWLFGDNVEDRLGHGGFLVLFLLAGMGAGLCHALISPDPSVPVVGASGAISGVMAAYAVLFPNARLISLILVFQLHWRASTYLGIWLVLQVIGAFFSDSQVAWWAHIGGFAVGWLMARKRFP